MQLHIHVFSRYMASPGSGHARVPASRSPTIPRGTSTWLPSLLPNRGLSLSPGTVIHGTVRTDWRMTTEKLTMAGGFSNQFMGTPKNGWFNTRLILDGVLLFWETKRPFGSIMVDYCYKWLPYPILRNHHMVYHGRMVDKWVWLSTSHQAHDHGWCLIDDWATETRVVKTWVA